MDVSFLDIVKIAIVPTIAAISGIVVSYLNRKNIKELHILINSNLQGWIGLAVAEALQRGTAAGIEKERARIEIPSPGGVIAMAIEKGIADGIAKAAVLPDPPPDVSRVPTTTDPRIVVAPVLAVAPEK
jgi:hypothetical protein